MDKHVIKQAPLYKLLRTEHIKAFNEQRDHLDTSELNNSEHRDFDLLNDTAAFLYKTTDLNCPSHERCII